MTGARRKHRSDFGPIPKTIQTKSGRVLLLELRAAWDRKAGSDGWLQGIAAAEAVVMLALPEIEAEASSKVETGVEK